MNLVDRVKKGMAAVDSTMMARMPKDFQEMQAKRKAPKPKGGTPSGS
jgi:hypothetical protein